MEEIKAWLNSPEKDINAGIALFQMYSRNRALLLYLTRKRDERKLIYELEKLAKHANLKPVTQPRAMREKMQTAPPPAPDPDGHKIIKPKRVNREDLPDALKVVYDGVAEAYKLQRVVHEKMKLSETDEDRAALRAELVKLDDDIAAGWDAIDQGMMVPEPEAPKVAEKQYTVQDIKAINSARTYISRAIKKFNPDQKAKLIERINQLISLEAAVSIETRNKLIELNVIDQNSNLLGK
ncbi:MAG: hypothetical protein PF694_09185 [Bacteroidetes bacterium]|jgi:hypothetical protein|nr:hypothetical protein [Bacteroidota bacterium]